MTLAGLLKAALDDPALARARDLAAGGGPGSPQVDLTGPPAVRPFVAAALAAPTDRGGAGRPVLAVTATTREAEELAAALADLLPEDTAAVYPAWETLPHERLSPRSDTVGRRLAVLRRLAHPQGRPLSVVTAPVRAVLQPQLAGLGDLEPVRVRTGDTVDLADLARRLTDLAYQRVDLVTKRGEFAVRGGILDVFPPVADHPLRLELWGDEVEEIRAFSVADQRALATADQLEAPPCRELLLTPEVRQRAAELAAAHPELADIAERLAEGIPVEGMESLAPALADGELELLVDCLPAGSLVLLCDPERIRTRAHDMVRTSEEFREASWAAAATGGKAPVDLDAVAFRTLAQVRAAATGHGFGWWTLSPFAGTGGLAGSVGAGGEAARSEARELEEITGLGAGDVLDTGDAGDVADAGEPLTLAAQPVPLYHG